MLPESWSTAVTPTTKSAAMGRRRKIYIVGDQKNAVIIIAFLMIVHSGDFTNRASI